MSIITRRKNILFSGVPLRRNIIILEYTFEDTMTIAPVLLYKEMGEAAGERTVGSMNEKPLYIPNIKLNSILNGEKEFPMNRKICLNINFYI